MIKLSPAAEQNIDKCVRRWHRAYNFRWDESVVERKKTRGSAQGNSADSNILKVTGC